jgi:putative addiction module killer protein
MQYTIVTTDEFDEWLEGLADLKAKGNIAQRIVRMGEGNLGDVKSLGDGVSEARVAVGPGYRLYYTIRERVMIVMICAGDKGSQERDIKRAKKLAKDI